MSRVLLLVVLVTFWNPFTSSKIIIVVVFFAFFEILSSSLSYLLVARTEPFFPVQSFPNICRVSFVFLFRLTKSGRWFLMILEGHLVSVWVFNDLNVEFFQILLDDTNDSSKPFYHIQHFVPRSIRRVTRNFDIVRLCAVSQVWIYIFLTCVESKIIFCDFTMNLLIFSVWWLLIQGILKLLRKRVRCCSKFPCNSMIRLSRPKLLFLMILSVSVLGVQYTLRYSSSFFIMHIVFSK